MQATVSVIRNSEVVRIICMETAVGACNSVHYSVDVRYWECPLIESTVVLYQALLLLQHSADKILAHNKLRLGVGESGYESYRLDMFHVNTSC